jgi:putative NADH-flavin reductase
MTRRNPALRIENESGLGQTRWGPQVATAPLTRQRKLELVIFAATGGIGRQAVAQALAAGHDVTAVVRNPKALPAGVRSVTANLEAADPATLESAVRGADAVISGLGPRPLRDAGIAARGTRAIVGAMKAAGVRRLIVVSAAPISTVPSPGRPNPPRHDPGDGFFMRHLFGPLAKTALRGRYADLAEMEDIVRDSGLDWTIVRPPSLNNKPLTGSYRTAFGRNIRGGFSISRADVAHLMLAALERPATIGQVIGIAN